MNTSIFDNVKLKDKLIMSDDPINGPNISASDTYIVSSVPIKFQNDENAPYISQTGSGLNSSINIGFNNNNISVNSDNVNIKSLNAGSLNVDIINNTEFGDYLPSDLLLINGKNVLGTNNCKVLFQSPNVTLTGEKYSTNINSFGVIQQDNVKSARKLYISSSNWDNTKILKADIITVEGFTGGYVVSNISLDVPNSKVIISLFNKLEETKITNVITSVTINNNIITINGISLTSNLFRNNSVIRIVPSIIDNLIDKYYTFNVTSVRSDIITGTVNISKNISYNNPSIFLVSPGNGSLLKVFSNISSYIEPNNTGLSIKKGDQFAEINVKRINLNDSDIINAITPFNTGLLTDSLKSIKITVNNEEFYIKLYKNYIPII